MSGAFKYIREAWSSTLNDVGVCVGKCRETRAVSEGHAYESAKEVDTTEVHKLKVAKSHREVRDRLKRAQRDLVVIIEEFRDIEQYGTLDDGAMAYGVTCGEYFESEERRRSTRSIRVGLLSVHSTFIFSQFSLEHMTKDLKVWVDIRSGKQDESKARLHASVPMRKLHQSFESRGYHHHFGYEGWYPLVDEKSKMTAGCVRIGVLWELVSNVSPDMALAQSPVHWFKVHCDRNRACACRDDQDALLTSRDPSITLDDIWKNSVYETYLTCHEERSLRCFLTWIKSTGNESVNARLVAFLRDPSSVPDERSFAESQLAQKISVANRETITALVHNGIPRKVRPLMWSVLASRLAKSSNAPCVHQAHDEFRDMCKSGAHDVLFFTNQVAEDVKGLLSRISPSQIEPNMEGAILRLVGAYLRCRGSSRYCESIPLVGYHLMRVCNNEQVAFKVLLSLTDHVLCGYYTRAMVGLRRDVKVVHSLLQNTTIELQHHLQNLGAPVDLILAEWLLCVFAETVPNGVLDRLWDMILFEGPNALMATVLAFFKVLEPEIMRIKDLPGLYLLLRENMMRFHYEADLIVALASHEMENFDQNKIGSLRSKRQASVALEIQQSPDIAELHVHANMLRLNYEKTRALMEKVSQVLKDMKRASDEKKLQRRRMILENPTATLPIDPSIGRAYHLSFDSFLEIVSVAIGDPQGTESLQSVSKGLFYPFEKRDNRTADVRRILCAIVILSRLSVNCKIEFCFQAFDPFRSGRVSRSNVERIIKLMYIIFNHNIPTSYVRSGLDISYRKLGPEKTKTPQCGRSDSTRKKQGATQEKKQNLTVLSSPVTQIRRYNVIMHNNGLESVKGGLDFGKVGCTPTRGTEAGKPPKTPLSVSHGPLLPIDPNTMSAAKDARSKTPVLTSKTTTPANSRQDARDNEEPPLELEEFKDAVLMQPLLSECLRLVLPRDYDIERHY